MSDLIAAAAAAGCPGTAAIAAAAAAAAYDGDSMQCDEPQGRSWAGSTRDNPYELPSVDDLEVAALAAASAMAAMQELQQVDEDDEETTDSSDGSSDDDSSESSDVSMDADDAEPAAAAQPQHQPVMLQVTPTADGHVSVMLTVNNKLSSTETNGRVMTHHDDAMDRGEGNSSDAAEDTTSSDSSSSDGCSSSIEEAEDPVGGLLAGPDITSYAEMRDMIDRAYRVEDEEGAAPTSLQEDLGWEAAAADVSGLVVPEGAQLLQAGTISSLLEGMVVVQGLENSRALDIGSVLLLEDKTPLGHVEEVFGPLTRPLYALRYSGPKEPPTTLATHARVFYTESLAQLVGDDVYSTSNRKGHKAAAVEEAVDVHDGEEPYFSDDEEEAEWRRSQGLTKRKHGGEGASKAGTGVDVDDGSGKGRGRGRGRGRTGSGGAGRGGGSSGTRGGGRAGRGQVTGFRAGQQPPSPGFRAHATAGQLQNINLQQSPQQVPHHWQQHGGYQQGAVMHVAAPAPPPPHFHQQPQYAHLPHPMQHAQQMQHVPGWGMHGQMANGVQMRGGYTNAGSMQAMPQQQHHPAGPQQNGASYGHMPAVTHGGPQSVQLVPAHPGQGWQQWTGYGAPPPGSRPG